MSLRELRRSYAIFAMAWSIGEAKKEATVVASVSL
jgi:hypothetical protein